MSKGIKGSEGMYNQDVEVAKAVKATDEKWADDLAKLHESDEWIAKKEKFLTWYESRWDYTHVVFERGMLLEYFITEKRPDHEWMFQGVQPAHISEVPEAIREEYLAYIKQSLMEFWDIPTVEQLEKEYTLDAAVDEWIECDVDEDVDLDMMAETIEDDDEVKALDAIDDKNRDMTNNPDSYFEQDDPRRNW